MISSAFCVDVLLGHGPGRERPGRVQQTLELRGRNLSPGSLRCLEFAGQDVREGRAMKKRGSGDLRRCSPESAAGYSAEGVHPGTRLAKQRTLWQL